MEMSSGTEWVRVFSRRYGVQYCEIFLNSQGGKYRRVFPKNIERQLFIPENANQTYCVEKKEWQGLSNALLNYAIQDQETFRKRVDMFYTIGENYIKKAQLATKTYSESTEEQKQGYLSYQQIWADYTGVLRIFFDLHNYYADLIEKKIAEYLGSMKNDALVEQYHYALVKPIEKNTIIKLQETILLLKERNDIEELDKVFQEYKWIPCQDIHNPPWTKEEFNKFVDSIETFKQIREIPYEEVIQKIGVTEKDKQLFDLTKELSYIRDKRDDFRRKGIYYVQRFFDKVAANMGITLKEFSYLTEKEVVDFLDKEIPINIEQIQKRKQGFLLFLKDGQTGCIVNPEIESTLEKRFDFDLKAGSGENEIKGIPACKGKVTGTVKIVKSVHDLIKVEKGDVMVAVTTHPDYIAAMHRAKAIVTDEGGMTCHAAIVSREIGTPCVVGTKNATKVLINGEKVEVDADKGVVRKLK